MSEEKKNTESPTRDELTDAIQQKYVKFKKDPTNKNEVPKNLIYLDQALVQKYLREIMLQFCYNPQLFRTRATEVITAAMRPMSRSCSTV